MRLSRNRRRRPERPETGWRASCALGPKLSVASAATREQPNRWDRIGGRIGGGSGLGAPGSLRVSTGFGDVALWSQPRARTQEVLRHGERPSRRSSAAYLVRAMPGRRSGGARIFLTTFRVDHDPAHRHSRASVLPTCPCGGGYGSAGLGRRSSLLVANGRGAPRTRRGGRPARPSLAKTGRAARGRGAPLRAAFGAPG